MTSPRRNAPTAGELWNPLVTERLNRRLFASNRQSESDPCSIA